MKIATIVVTFNRKNDLLVNIKSQLNQKLLPYKIIIVDNASTDGTYEFLKENLLIDNPIVIYERLSENIGGAGGFEYGVKYAHENTDAEAYVLMDDDGCMINSETLYNLISRTPTNPLYMMNSWLVFDKNKPITAAAEGIADDEIKDFICPFNCTFISRALVEKIGLPNGAFFIRGDEVDYSMRAREAGAYISTVCSSLYYHPKLSVERKKFGINFSVCYDSPWKEYYGTRNATYRMVKTSKLHAWLSYKKRIVGLYLFNIKDKKTFKQFIKLGYKHGKRGILGKTILPGQKIIKNEDKNLR